ncbi:hypothetical protein ACLOJK_004938 [Asimina triloba]
MKIFNWLQRKLHRNADYKMLSLDQEMKSTKYDRDEEALLDQAALVEMLDGWHDGILTIGTFGLDQLDPFSSTEEENSIRAADDDDEEEEEEDSLNALEAFERELEALKDSLSGMYADDEMPKYCPLNDNDADDDALHYSFDPEGEKKSNEGRRTTLADLFLADSTPVAATKSSSGAAAEDLEKKKKLASRSKLSPSFAKKREDSRPTMKLRRRKIHPEMGRDALVADRSVHPALLGPARSDCRFKLPRYCGHKHRENESISLLIGDAALEG